LSCHGAACSGTFRVARTVVGPAQYVDLPTEAERFTTVALRDKLRTNAAPHLQPDETIQAVFCAQTTSAYFALISYWIILFSNSYRVVVVTDRRILVCASGRMSMTPVKEILLELPRATRIGPPSGVWWRCETLGQKVYVHRRFHKDVNVADAALMA
jgi:hypothetical protein